MRLVAKCLDCSFENPRGWVTCARCGSLLGPRVRRIEDSGLTTSTTNRFSALAQAAVDPDEPTRVYRASGERPPENAASAAAPPTASVVSAAPVHTDARPLLGQAQAESELERALIRVAQEQHARLVLVYGAPGAGKTRFLHRASEIGARMRSAFEVHHAALRSGDDGPYAPLSRLLLDRFGVAPASSPSAVRSDMQTNVSDALGVSAQIGETTHLLGHVIGVPFPESVLLRDLERDPAALHGQALQAVARFVAAEARARPQLWLLDELGGAEPQAFDLLDALLELEVPLVIVASGSPSLRERVAALRGAQQSVDHIELLPLAAPDATQLVRILLPDLVELPEELASALMHRSGGNPQKLVELLRALQDGGLFRREESGVVVDLAQLEHGALPLTMADTIRARLTTLPAPEGQVLRDAAIVGERFWAGALLALARAREPLPDASISVLQVWAPNDDELALQTALDALEAKGFIVRIGDADAPGLDEYTFAYAGTRAVVYAELSKDERAERHALVARWLALTSGLVVESMAALLAPHLEHAGAHDRAARAYLQAVADERARMRTTMALVYVEKALPLIDAGDVPKRIEALHERGSLLVTLGRHEEARGAFEEIVRLAWMFGARGRGGAALNRIARIERERGDHEAALDHLRAGMLLFSSIGNKRGVASSYDDMAQIHRMRGELEAALSAAGEALEIRKQARDRRAQAASLNTIGHIELDLGRYDSAEARFATALKIREAIGDHEGAVQTRIHLGQLVFQRGRVDEAIRIYLDALERARELNHQRFQSYALTFLGVAYMAQADVERADRALRDAKRLAGALRDQHVLADIERHLAGLTARRAEAAKPS